MKTLWRQLVQPHIDYCSQVYQPTGGNELQSLECLQRNFTSKIREVRHLNYWDRLTYLQMTSQHRRLERYRILYVWKVLEGLVPDCKIEVTASNRLGRMCVIPPLKRNAPAKIKTMRESSFNIHGGRLFNSCPKDIRNISRCSVDEFKEKLDIFRSQIPDEPSVPGTEYTPSACDLFTSRPSNSLIDQIRHNLHNMNMTNSHQRHRTVGM